MDKLLDTASKALGLLGVVVIVLTGALRLKGDAIFMGFESITLFIGGIAMMVMSILIKTHFKD